MSYIRLINYFNLGRLGQVSPDARLPDGLGAGQRSRRHCYSGKVRLAILTRSFLCRLLCSSACPFNSLLSFIRLQADYFKSLLSYFFPSSTRFSTVLHGSSSDLFLQVSWTFSILLLQVTWTICFSRSFRTFLLVSHADFFFVEGRLWLRNILPRARD